MYQSGFYWYFIGAGQIVAADFIVKKVDAYAGFRLTDKSPLHLPANLIVVHDEKLKENVGLRGVDAAVEEHRKGSIDGGLVSGGAAGTGHESPS